MINPASALLAILAVLLVVAAVGDIRARTIPNMLNAAIALLAIPFWFAIGLGGHAILIQIGLACAVLLVFALCFMIGAMGGGDVKMLAALALWVPLGKMASFLVWMAIAGGILALGMLILHRLRRRSDRIEVPYGVAISVAAFLVMIDVIRPSA